MGRYDATWAAGKVDGVDVLVAGAAKLVGKKATVTIGRVLEGQAFATLVPSGEVGEGPITFESEAEKPTRAPAKRKVTAPADGEEMSLDEVDVASVEELDPGHDIDVEEGGEAEDVADATEDGELAVSGVESEPGIDGATPAKKRTRRGSRGGRRRRKPAGAGVDAAGADDTDGAVDGEPAVGLADDLVAPAIAAVSGPDGNGSVSEKPKAPARRRAPRIHVPGDPDSQAASPDVIQDAIVEVADVTRARR